ncbi:MAG: DUF4491 family protein [Anaerolineaceae bacterium]|nr:DUF4491 family protein [Anaerolineaceae bacterium]
MTINPIGMLTAITTIITIWFGHVMVRRVEARVERVEPAIAVCIFLGLFFGTGAVLVDSNQHSAILGIIGITFLWDALEIKRQQKRVKMGHAPANPKNPRHLTILTEFATATPVDILDREPCGKPYSQAELTAMLNAESKIEANS